MVILQQVLNFESLSLDYFCSNMVFGPCWVSGIILWLDNLFSNFFFFLPAYKAIKCCYVLMESWKKNMKQRLNIAQGKINTM